MTPHPAPAAPSLDPATLRRRLADRLRSTGAARTAPVDAALGEVPRHLFLPNVPIEQAYSDQPVATKHDAAGAAISAASEPTIVTTMLEQLGVEPGHRILEIGAGTGYNAALLAHLTGDHGHVTTMDVDEDIVTAARAHLAAAGVGNVTVRLGDGALGHPDAAPYDRIIATVGAWDLPVTWRRQLAPGGRIVVPLRLRGSIARSIAFERDEDDGWVSRSSHLCTFMPLRGIADDARRNLPLTPDATVAVETHHDQQVDPALAGALDHPASTIWTGVTFTGSESFEWLDLWLACMMDNAISRMPVRLAAVDAGLVAPQFGWGSMAVIDAADLAYLTLRPVHDSGRYEVGLVGHGPNADQLAQTASAQVQAWDRDHRASTVDFQLRPTHSAPAETPPSGTTRFTFARPGAQLVITWRQP
ncbi:methyltransferase, FxLD system [Jiangella alkaliphila]|uniref:methyltransferase, FxLD system n=1 Tax=Jiangella alkaliphila TaxID=419479 RepID=UPI000629088A|nr:methyltransferase, FxLD system [Jiangella alkaliphila]